MTGFRIFVVAMLACVTLFRESAEAGHGRNQQVLFLRANNSNHCRQNDDIQLEAVRVRTVRTRNVGRSNRQVGIINIGR